MSMSYCAFRKSIFKDHQPVQVFLCRLLKNALQMVLDCHEEIFVRCLCRLLCSIVQDTRDHNSGIYGSPLKV